MRRAATSAATIRTSWDTLPSAFHESRFRQRRGFADRKNRGPRRRVRIAAEGAAEARARRRGRHAVLPAGTAMVREERCAGASADADAGDPVGELDRRGDVLAGVAAGDRHSADHGRERLFLRARSALLRRARRLARLPAALYVLL